IWFESRVLVIGNPRGTRIGELHASLKTGFVERLPRSDNGGPFASPGLAGLSQLSVWWIRLGIIPERIAPGHPEQNGSHEQFHSVLKGGNCPAAGGHGGRAAATIRPFLRGVQPPAPARSLAG